MRLCVFGAGSIGGLIAAKSITNGADVWVHDRERRIKHIRVSGIEFVSDDDCSHTLRNVQIADISDDSVTFDALILAVKAHHILSSLNALTALLRRSRMLVTVQNGIPWWYFQRHGGPLENTVLTSVDPGGAISRAIDPDHIIGCVAYPAAEMSADGVIRHVEGRRFTFGELDGARSARLEEISKAFEAAGFRSRVSNDIRNELWVKALGNLSFNPVSALTGLTMKQMYDLAPSRDVIRRMMVEAEQVAERLGIRLRVSIDRRLEGGGKVGHHRTSMLQDLDAGRRLEIDGLLGTVVEIAAMLDMKTPTLSAVYELTRALDQSCATDAVG